MANEALIFSMIRERNAAIFAKNRSAATAAECKPGVTPPIHQNDRLRAGCQPFCQCGSQRLRKWRGAVARAKIFAQIHDSHLRHGTVLHSRAKAEQLVLSFSRMMKTLHRRRSRTEQRHRVLE